MNSVRQFHKSRLPSISEVEWSRIALLLANTGRCLMPHEVGNEAGIAYSTAQALLLGLAGDQLADCYWLIYHKCVPVVIWTRKMTEGPLPVPVECPECDEVIADDSQLMYDICCRLRGAVELV